MTLPRPQRGFLLIVAVVIILVAAIMAVVMATFTAGSGQGGAANVLSTQAMYVAESGLEFEQRRLAQNVDWYRMSSDPFDNATNNVGQGSYTEFVNLPATEVTKETTTGATTINVFAAAGARWSATGRLLVINDGFDFSASGGYTDPGGPGNNSFELMSYTGTTAISFAVGAAGRNVSVGSVRGGAAASSFSRGDFVYPVALLGVGLSGASCATIPSPFTINNDNGKFLDRGTLTIFHQTTPGDASTTTAEQITYSDSTVSGTVRTLLGVQRCQNGTSPILAAINDPVAPVVAGVSPPGVNNYDFEAAISATGTVGSAQRVVFKTVQR